MIEWDEWKFGQNKSVGNASPAWPGQPVRGCRGFSGAIVEVSGEGVWESGSREPGPSGQREAQRQTQACGTWEVGRRGGEWVFGELALGVRKWRQMARLQGAGAGGLGGLQRE